MLLPYYETLAEKAKGGDVESLRTLMVLSRYDERALGALASKRLTPLVLQQLEEQCTDAAQYLCRAIWYDKEGGDFVADRFINVCQTLSRSDENDVAMRVAVAQLLIHIARVQPYRADLFNYSESFRHFLQDRDPFFERAVCGVLAFAFCDDFLGDAVAKMQYKTDVLNYMNNVFTRTHDFAAWRYSVRCLSIAGGYNEDKVDVDHTRKIVMACTEAGPEGVLYAVVGYGYARMRHIPTSLYRVHVPRWVASRRAVFAAFYVSLLGVFSGTFTQWWCDQYREHFALARQQEWRRRRGAELHGTAYEKKVQFDDLTGAIRGVHLRQMVSYSVTGAGLFLSVCPLAPKVFPKWFGDIKFKHPWVPVLFPIAVGVPAPNHRVVPYIVAPFVAVKVFQHFVLGPTTLTDWFVQAKQRYIGEMDGPSIPSE